MAPKPDIDGWIPDFSRKDAAVPNPADSGESGILLLPFALPWIMWLPGASLGLPTGWTCIVLNAGILYLIFGSLRPERH